jgi:hypothetical protein
VDPRGTARLTQVCPATSEEGAHFWLKLAHVWEEAGTCSANVRHLEPDLQAVRVAADVRRSARHVGRLEDVAAEAALSSSSGNFLRAVGTDFERGGRRGRGGRRCRFGHSRDGLLTDSRLVLLPRWANRRVDQVVGASWKTAGRLTPGVLNATSSRPQRSTAVSV